ncbi:MAG: hypothetical protein OEM48_02965 [Gammaproteobacteria bacterium]|nr:hypothetical protein [Gammaproteobacteria bacterium]
MLLRLRFSLNQAVSVIKPHGTAVAMPFDGLPANSLAGAHRSAVIAPICRLGLTPCARATAVEARERFGVARELAFELENSFVHGARSILRITS